MNPSLLDTPGVAPEAPPLEHAHPAPASAWQPGFAALGDAFFTPVDPTPLPAPRWVAHSPEVGAALGLPAGWHSQEAWLQMVSGNALPEGVRSLASVYSGHQFGVWAGQLGDGRALLLGERQGLEVQLKGAGLTPYSRMGDGRAVLRSSIREFLCSEAMQGLGVPTTRALSITASPAPVVRETVETAAVVTRVAPSFIRFGHFEHFCHHQLHDELRALADYVIDRYYLHCRADAARAAPAWQGSPYAALLAAVTARTAELLAHWQSVGFCHGVMNTDNMSILGLTIDYGPFQFLDAYDPGHICNHSDHSGRYAFQRQPGIAHWNLYCLGQALLPLIDEQELAIEALDTYRDLYPQALARRMAAKLGFAAPVDGQADLLDALHTLMAADRVDYPIFWRRLSHLALQGFADPAPVADLFIQRDAAQAWLRDYRLLAERLGTAHDAPSMLRTNPKYVLRNHVGELAIQAARAGDFSLVQKLHTVLSHPCDEHPDMESFADFPPDWAASIAISCSS